MAGKNSTNYSAANLDAIYRFRGSWDTIKEG
jgi:hypothetical protein